MLQDLRFTQNLAILGQYDIWVRSGAISILGAAIHASSQLHRVYAPSTHSIPPIRSVPNPFGTGNAPVELTIISCRSRMRMLRQIAPKFGRIWNGRQHSKSSSDFSKRSFMNVSILNILLHHPQSFHWRDCVEYSHILGAITSFWPRIVTSNFDSEASADSNHRR